jgi:hypothetical protein
MRLGPGREPLRRARLRRLEPRVDLSLEFGGVRHMQHAGRKPPVSLPRLHRIGDLEGLLHRDGHRLVPAFAHGEMAAVEAGQRLEEIADLQQEARAGVCRLGRSAIRRFPAGCHQDPRQARESRPDVSARRPRKPGSIRALRVKQVRVGQPFRHEVSPDSRCVQARCEGAAGRRGDGARRCPARRRFRKLTLPFPGQNCRQNRCIRYQS